MILRKKVRGEMRCFRVLEHNETICDGDEYVSVNKRDASVEVLTKLDSYPTHCSGDTPFEHPSRTYLRKISRREYDQLKFEELESGDTL